MKKEKLPLEAEKQLVERAKENLEAFGELYDLYIDDIYLYVAYRVGRAVDAEDLTAQVFEKAMRNLHSFEWKGLSFGAWLYTIARNLVIDTYKQDKKLISVDEVAEFVKDEANEGPEEEASKSYDIRRMMMALAKLPEDQQEVIFLRYIKELSIAEVMEITGRSVDSVKSLAKRGLASLRKLIESKADLDDEKLDLSLNEKYANS